MSCKCAEDYARLIRDINFSLRVFESPETRGELAPRWIHWVADDLENVGKSCPISTSMAMENVFDAKREIEAKDYLDASDLLVRARENMMKSITNCVDKEERARKAGRLREWLEEAVARREEAEKKLEL